MIEQISVKDLFGHLTYTLPQTGTLEEAAILYGDNGTGKTTILKLVYHMLSPAHDGGHRTAISKIPFSNLSIFLKGDIELRATRVLGTLVGPCLFQMLRDNELVAEWDYVPGAKRLLSGEYSGESVRALYQSLDRHQKDRLSERELRILVKGRGSVAQTKEGEALYLHALTSIGFRISLLSAERQIYSDDAEQQGLSYDTRSLMREESFAQLVEKGREMSLRAAMLLAWQWVASQGVAGTNTGGDNANVVYTDIVKRLSRSKQGSKDAPDKSIDTKKLIDSLVRLHKKSLEMSKYNFMPGLKTDEIIEVLGTARTSVLPILQTVLEPYINGQQARISALEDVYQVTHRFVSTLNDFYKGKRVELDLGKGMTITNEFDGLPLDPVNLSSGEQQLLLLFCHTLVSRSRPSIFIIDEPELSLNVKWQRKLVQKLLEVSQGTSTQFLFASHSLELLTQHSDRVVKLKPAGKI